MLAVLFELVASRSSSGKFARYVRSVSAYVASSRIVTPGSWVLWSLHTEPDSARICSIPSANSADWSRPGSFGGVAEMVGCDNISVFSLAVQLMLSCCGAGILLASQKRTLPNDWVSGVDKLLDAVFGRRCQDLVGPLRPHRWRVEAERSRLRLHEQLEISHEINERKFFDEVEQR